MHPWTFTANEPRARAARITPRILSVKDAAACVALDVGPTKLSERVIDSPRRIRAIPAYSAVVLAYCVSGST